MRAPWLVLLALPVPAPAALTQAPAWSWSTTDPAREVEALAVGDIDGDGLPDLLVGTVSDGAVEVEGFRGVGDTFEIEPSWHVDGPADGGRVALAVADVDGDGFADLVLGAPLAGDGDGRVALHEGGPLGPDPLPAVVWTGGSHDQLGSALALGDADGDGIVDLLADAPATGGRDGSVSGWRGPLAAGAPTWQLVDTFCCGAGEHRALALADVDLDGDDDVVRTVGLAAFPTLAWHPGGPAGPRQDAARVPWAVAVTPALTALGDTDGDGLVEVATGTGGGPRDADGSVERWVYAGADPAPFGPAVDGVGERLGAALAGADVDGDGRVDVVAGGPVLDHVVPRQGRVTVIAGGRRSWLWGPPVADGRFGHALAAAGDLDGDGRSEVVVAGRQGAWLHRGLDPEADQDRDGIPVTADCHDAHPMWGKRLATGACPGAPCQGDDDADGHGAASLISADADCLDPGELGLDAPGGDCDDGISSVNPGIAEVIGNGRDDDCDCVDLCRADLDGDGFPGPLPVPSGDGDCTDPGEHEPAPMPWAGDEVGLVTRPAVTVVGDVDGDGAVEVLLRMPDATVPQGMRGGVVALYRVGRYGPVPTGWRREGAAREQLGLAAVGELDVDGDGTDDLVVAGVAAPPGAGGPRQHLVAWYGRAGGPAADPDWRFVSAALESDRGLLGGDVDGDGFDDVVAQGGRTLLVFAGGPAGLPAGPTWVVDDVEALLGVGDADGDGDADLGVLRARGVVVLPGGRGGPAGAAPVDRRLRDGGRLLWGDVDGDGVPDMAQHAGAVTAWRGLPGRSAAELAGLVPGREGALGLAGLALVPDDDGDGRASLRVHHVAMAGAGVAPRVASWAITDGRLVPDGVQLVGLDGVLAHVGGCRPMVLGVTAPITPGAPSTPWAVDLVRLRPDPDDDDAGVPVDAGCGPAVCRPDADGDGAGAIGRLLPAVDGRCDAPGLATTARADCDDARADVHDRAVEVPGDGVDQDCDGLELCLLDADGDGWGDPSRSVLASSCSHAPDRVDCDDGDAAVHPGDPSCDGAGACLADADGDGVAGPGATAAPPGDGDCLDPGEAAPGSVDCDDADPTRSGLAIEVPGDGIDQDCDGVDACRLDADGDGFVGATWGPGPGPACPRLPVGDCADHDAAAHPGGAEVAGDGVDGDCGGRELCFVDADRDGAAGSRVVVSGSLRCGLPGLAPPGAPPDCDDSDRRRSPLLGETVGDGLDGDCDGIELCAQDLDGDGFPAGAAIASADAACGDVPGAVDPGRDPVDCDDADAHAFPGGPDPPSDGVDGDCDGAESCLRDEDGDGWPSTERTFSPSGRCDEPGRWSRMPWVLPGVDGDLEALVAADVDGDGDVDLVTRSTDVGLTSIPWRAGPVFATDEPVAELGLPLGPGAWLRLVGDVDGNGIDDLVAGDEDGSLVLRGTPDGPVPAWELPIATALAPGPVDVDGDGRADVLVAEPSGAVTAWRVASADDPPSPLRLVQGEWWVWDLAAGDVDGDSRLDLVMSFLEDYWRRSLVVRDVLGAEDAADLDADVGAEVMTADVDGDGREDVVTRGEFGGVEVWRQGAERDRPQQWWRGTAGSDVPVGDRVRLADLDGNGTPEILSDAIDAWSMALWWTVPGRRPWREPGLATPLVPASESPRDLAFADVDGDGRTELLVVTRDQIHVVQLPALTSDCDDADAAVHPTAGESLDLPDTDCLPGERCPLDADEDGHAAASGAWGWSPTDDCDAPGLALGTDPADDCDDGDPDVAEGDCDDGAGCGCAGGPPAGAWLSVAALALARRKRARTQG